MRRMIAAEALGTMLLVATVVGSGIMAEQMADGNAAVALLGNTAATAATLYVLISLLGPISGAHFNPVVSWLLAPPAERPTRIVVQCVAALAGTLLAHAMFGRPPIEIAHHARTGPGQWLGEAVATFGLLLTIRLGARFRSAAMPSLVAGWIVAGYWFTASTSFANPAATLARMLTDSFSGIRPVDAAPFILAQIGGGLVGHACAGWLGASGAPVPPLLSTGAGPT
jgi:glycerol uptake facilitator-like aquaporin